VAHIPVTIPSSPRYAQETMLILHSKKSVKEIPTISKKLKLTVHGFSTKGIIYYHANIVRKWFI
jgi:hypothetical protein